jgi:hypothetical protein
VLNGNMFITGGSSGSGAVTNYYRDVWKSSDGKDWTKTASGLFGGRYESQMLSYNNQLFLIGGNKGGILQNDVWSSPDGVTWTQILPSNLSITANAVGTQFCPRQDFAAVVFNGLMWVIAGTDSTGNASALNDVWSSPDGITWTQVLINNGVPWSPAGTRFPSRWGLTATALNGSLYVIDGHMSTVGINTVYNDVWSSNNGSTWSMINAQFGPNYYHQTVANNNELWATGGYNGWNGGAMTLLASSPDGITWTNFPNSPYPARFGHLSLSFNNEVWVMGGCYNTGSLIYYHDVWHGP